MSFFPYYHTAVQTLLMKPKQIFDAIHLPVLSVLLDWDHYLVSALTLRISWRISIASAITELSKMNEFLVNSLPLRLFWKCSSIFASSLPCEIKAQPDILQRIFWDFSPSDFIPLSLSFPDTSLSIKDGFEFVIVGEFRCLHFFVCFKWFFFEVDTWAQSSDWHTYFVCTSCVCNVPF